VSVEISVSSWILSLPKYVIGRIELEAFPALVKNFATDPVCPSVNPEDYCSGNTDTAAGFTEVGLSRSFT
jgi:hypothetical protein